MIKNDSPSLREFYFKTPTKNGQSVAIKYGYDMSAKHSGFYIKASINKGAFLSDSKTLRKVRALKIPAFTSLINAIGIDVTGSPYNYEATAQRLVETYMDTESSTIWNSLLKLYNLGSEKEIRTLSDFIVKYNRASSKARTSLLTRYNNSRQISLIETPRDVVRGLRELYNEGLEINGVHVVPKYQGYLEQHHVLAHYKRDIDYIRKARVRLFKLISRKYVPFK